MNNNSSNVINGGLLPLEMWDHILSFASPDTLAQVAQTNKEIGAFAQERINKACKISSNYEKKQRMSNFRSNLTAQQRRWVSEARDLRSTTTSGWIAHVSSDASYTHRIKVSEKNIREKLTKLKKQLSLIKEGKLEPECVKTTFRDLEYWDKELNWAKFCGKTNKCALSVFVAVGAIGAIGGIAATFFF